jgi:glycosyltransferase involved in cell wall biosynthesis
MKIDSEFNKHIQLGLIANCTRRRERTKLQTSTFWQPSAERHEPATGEDSAYHKLTNVLIVTCAHNEARTLPALLETLNGYDVLLIDDGSTDSTYRVARNHRARVLRHQTRLGKVASIQDAIEFAMGQGYDAIVEIDADSIPSPSAVERLVDSLSQDDVGAVSARQIPLGARNLGYHLDEFLWSVMHHGKLIQMSRVGFCHLGGVMTAFKLREPMTVIGSINDDEMIGKMILKSGLRTAYNQKAVVYFDASSSIGHILERRKRMIVGHLSYTRSIAPSMDFGVASVAVVKSVLERLGRATWVVPAMVLECIARLAAWRDKRNRRKMEEYSRWVTKHAKNNIMAFHHRSRY